MTKLAISYARFSSAKQAHGHSLQRQLQASEAYARDHGLTLDPTLSFRDLGVSAYDRSNVRKGALGLFLKAVQEGRVPAGTTLIVESLDRLSRAQVLDAQAVFIELLNAGLHVVTLADGQSYSRESVNQNFAQLIISLAVMSRAHEESATKSKRIKASWANKKAKVKATGEIMTRKVPHWIKVNAERTKFSLDAARVKVVKFIIGEAEKGVGQHTIIKLLHGKGVAAFAPSGRWEPSYVQKLLTSAALYGAIDLDGELVEDYYPAVIDRQRFANLQAVRSERATRKTTNRGGKLVTNLFSGLLRCGYCGSSMTVAGYKSRKSGYDRKYVGCHGARTGKTACKMRVWWIDELEPKLLFWLTGVDYARIVGAGRRSAVEDERAQLALVHDLLDDKRGRRANVVTAIEEGARGLVARLEALDGEVAELERRVADQEAKVAAASLQEESGTHRMAALAKLFKALRRTTSEAQLRALREQLSASLATVVERVTLFPTGPTVDGDRAERYAEVTFKSGAVQTIEAGVGEPQTDADVEETTAGLELRARGF